mmetsp:Transcript_17186/g.31236  ORF Transcript_17186/g.31236 Transcript_17186/m.31236 type:complete len:91 (+) Transcript_17186:1081-1353(+)
MLSASCILFSYFSTLLESIGFQWSVKKRHPANQSGEEEDGGDEVEVDQAGKEEEDDDATGGNEDEANQPGEVDDDDDAYEDYVQSNCAGV